MPLPGLEHSDERPPDARFPTLPDAHGRLAHLRAHAPRLNERREQSQQHHRVTVWCGQPGHRREFAPAVSASISVYGMMLPRPSDRSSHLREVGASNIQTVNICRAGIVTEAVRTSTIASGARIHLYGSGIDRSAAESRLCRISGYTKLAFSTRTAVDLVLCSRPTDRLFRPRSGRYIRCVTAYLNSECAGAPTDRPTLLCECGIRVGDSVKN